jgi:protein-S-isoprenylcysteine O-methyltransferase Ste14
MTAVHPVRAGVDWGRLVVVPLFALLLLSNAMAVAHSLQGGLTQLAAAASATASCATLVFLVFVIVAYLRRGPATATTSSRTAKAASAMATFLPFVILPALGAGGGTGDDLAASVVITSGMAFAVWAVSALGRNLSVFPQTRRLAAHGPYRRVRHPLYTAEIIALVGVCLHTGRPLALVSVPVMVGLQAYRARAEETLLVGTLPGYAEYRSGTAALIPGLV